MKEGLEPPTFGLWFQHSNQLNYFICYIIIILLSKYTNVFNLTDHQHILSFKFNF